MHPVRSNGGIEGIFKTWQTPFARRYNALLYGDMGDEAITAAQGGAVAHGSQGSLFTNSEHAEMFFLKKDYCWRSSIVQPKWPCTAVSDPLSPVRCCIRVMMSFHHAFCHYKCCSAVPLMKMVFFKC